MRISVLAATLTVAAWMGLAATPSQADLFVTSGSTNAVFRYDGTTGAFISAISGGGLVTPRGMAFGPDGNLYVGGGPLGTSQVLRFNAATGAFLDVFVPPGSGGLALADTLAFGPDGNLYITGDGFTLDVKRYNGATGAFLGTFIPSSVLDTCGPDGLTFGSDGNLYVGCNTGSVLRFNGTTGALLDTFVPVGSGGLNGAEALVFGPDGSLYVSSQRTDQVLRYNGATGGFLDVFASGGGLDAPWGLAFGPDGNFYVASFNTNNVLRYNGRTGAFMDIFASGASPIAIAFTRVPEPSALTLIGIGALILGVSRWRHRPAGIKHVELRVRDDRASSPEATIVSDGGRSCYQFATTLTRIRRGPTAIVAYSCRSMSGRLGRVESGQLVGENFS